LLDLPYDVVASVDTLRLVTRDAHGHLARHAVALEPHHRGSPKVVRDRVHDLDPSAGVVPDLVERLSKWDERLSDSGVRITLKCLLPFFRRNVAEAGVTVGRSRPPGARVSGALYVSGMVPEPQPQALFAEWSRTKGS